MSSLFQSSLSQVCMAQAKYLEAGFLWMDVLSVALYFKLFLSKILFPMEDQKPTPFVHQGLLFTTIMQCQDEERQSYMNEGGQLRKCARVNESH